MPAVLVVVAAYRQNSVDASTCHTKHVCTHPFALASVCMLSACLMEDMWTETLNPKKLKQRLSPESQALKWSHECNFALAKQPQP